MDLEFSNKAVIVTGGTAGIGYEICRAFLKNNASLVFTSRHESEGKNIEEEFKKISKKCMYVKCNAENEDDIKELIKTTVDRFKKIDVVVNNAAVYIYKIMDECSAEDFDFIYKVNLKGYFLTCKYTIPFLKKTKGNIVNISSIVGEIGQYYTSLYCATKAGITGFTKSIALDYAKDGIRANVVLPGAIDTDGSNIGRKGNQIIYPKELIEISSKLQPLGRKLCSSKEVAYAVVVLASDNASGITGSSLVVDRGANLDFSPGLKTFYDN